MSWSQAASTFCEISPFLLRRARCRFSGVEAEIKMPSIAPTQSCHAGSFKFMLVLNASYQTPIASPTTEIVDVTGGWNVGTNRRVYLKTMDRSCCCCIFWDAQQSRSSAL